MPLVEKNLSDIVTLSRASARMNTSSAGVLTTLASGIFGIDYDPATLAVRGMPVEEQRTNLCLWNQQFDNAAWSKSNTTITANATTAPDGSVSADALIETATTGAHETLQSFTPTASAAYTLSCYVKAGALSSATLRFNVGLNGVSTSCTVDIAAGTITLAGGTATLAILNAGNGWYRVSMTATASGSPSSTQALIGTAFSSTGDGTSGIFIWGAQLEAGSFASSYMGETTTASITRLTDSLTIGTLSPWYNATEGTLYVEFMTGGDLAVTRAVVIDDGTNNQYIAAIVASGGGAGPYLAVVDGGASQASIPSGGVVAVNTIYKLAGAYKANDFAASRNGGAVSTDGGGTIPAVTTVRLGADSGANMLNGHLRKTIFYPIRKPDAELETMST